MRVAIHALIAAMSIVPAHCTSAAASGTNNTAPEVRSPMHRQRIGEPGDSLCEPAQTCHKIRAEGWISGRQTPFFAVAPVKASPRMWIQPRIHGVAADGSFSGLVNLGEVNKGAREYFKIFVFACASEDRFVEGQEITEFPDDCEISAPVEVYRER